MSIKNEKKLSKNINDKTNDPNADLALDSNEDLLSAIRQVAKEMAEAVKKTEKDIEKTRLITDKKENEAKITTPNIKNQNVVTENFEKENLQIKDMVTDKKEVLNSVNTKQLSTNPTNQSPQINIRQDNPIPPPINKEDTIEEEEDINLDEYGLDLDAYPKYEDYNLADYEIETDYIKKSFYLRNIESHKKIQQKLEIQRNKKLLEEMKYMKSKPELSKATKKIIKNKLSDYEPIYNRIEEEIFKKNQRLEFLRFSLADNEKTKESQYLSRFNTGYADKQQIDTFVQSQFEWKQKRDQKISNIKTEIEKIEQEASKYLFQPAILKSSETIANNKLKKQKDKEVHTRLYNLHEENIKKKKKMQMKCLPTFKPNINKNYPNYLKKEKVTDLEGDDDGDNTNDDNNSYKENEEEQNQLNNIEQSLWNNVGIYNKPAYTDKINTNTRPVQDKDYAALQGYHDHIFDGAYNSQKPKHPNRSELNNSTKHNTNILSVEPKINPIQDNFSQDDFFPVDDSFINAYKSNLDNFHGKNSYNTGFNNKKKTNVNNSAQNLPQNIIHKEKGIYHFPNTLQNSSHKDENVTINDWPEGLNNLYKINTNDKHENKIVATPQFATMLKKNFNVVANAKVKYTK